MKNISRIHGPLVPRCMRHTNILHVISVETKEMYLIQRDSQCILSHILRCEGFVLGNIYMNLKRCTCINENLVMF